MITILVLLRLACGSMLRAEEASREVRVYCKSDGDGILFEHKAPGASFTEQNKIYNVPTMVIDEGEIPPFRSRSQLKCEGGKLVIDPTVKTRSMLKREEVNRMETELDTELGKERPDLVKALRLKRAVELRKKGREVPFPLK